MIAFYECDNKKKKIYPKLPYPKLPYTIYLVFEAMNAYCFEQCIYFYACKNVNC